MRKNSKKAHFCQKNAIFTDFLAFLAIFSLFYVIPQKRISPRAIVTNTYTCKPLTHIS